MLRILTKTEKKDILYRLGGLIQKFKRDGNDEMWWHSQRISYSLEHELVPQTVYVDKYPDFNYIISKYTNKQSGKNIEVYTVCKDSSVINKSASEDAISMIASEDISYGQIQASPYYLQPFLHESIRKHGVNLFEDVGANGMTFPYQNIKEMIYNIRPIDGFVCRPLAQGDAELVNNRFKYAKHPDTYKWIKKSLTTLPSMGCYNKKDELVGQFIIMESGNIGGLYVIDECKGLKLGKWIVQEMTKYLHEINYPMVLETEFSNKVSYSLFTGLGFEVMAQSYYMLLSKHSEIHDEI